MRSAKNIRVILTLYGEMKSRGKILNILQFFKSCKIYADTRKTTPNISVWYDILCETVELELIICVSDDICIKLEFLA